jgi:Protein of unknown function (DUF669)
MPLNLDFTNVRTLDMNPLPAGEYYLQVVSCIQKMSSTGKAMLEWRYRVVGGQFENRQLFQNTMLQPENLWKLKQNLVGLGFTDDDLGGNIQLEPSEMIGLECYAIVTQREYNNQMRNEVSRLISIDDYAKSHGLVAQTFVVDSPAAGAVEAAAEVQWEEEDNSDIPFAVASEPVVDPKVNLELVEDEDEEDDDEPVTAITATKAASRLAETYNVTLQDISTFTGRPEVSRQDVLDYVATLNPSQAQA